MNHRGPARRRNDDNATRVMRRRRVFPRWGLTLILIGITVTILLLLP